jgi:tricorn protease
MTADRARAADFGRAPFSSFAILLGLAAATATAAAQAPARGDGPPLLFRSPALSATEICFTFGGDLWLVPRAGGDARRLTASAAPATAADCRFSPDGKWIAYTSTSGVNSSVYVVPAAGGAPRRLTWHPGINRVRGWTPDGRVLYVSTRASYAMRANATPRLYTQALDAVAPTAIDLPSGWDASYSADGKRLAYMPIRNANEVWKHYRGGETTPIWIATLANAAIERVPRENSSDIQPMWVGDTVFFLSDRDGPTTLYSYALASKRVAKRVDNTGLDIKNASVGPGAIVYEQFGAIRLFDLATGKTSPVPIRLAGELSATLPRWVSVSDKLQHPALSPTGVRVALEARGVIIKVAL